MDTPTVTIAETTDDEPAKIDVRQVGESRYIDLQIGDRTFTFYPTVGEVRALRHALFDIQ